MRSRLVLPPAAIALVLCLAPALATAAGPGDTLLLSGLPGLAAPDPADFEFNRSGSGDDERPPTQVDVTADGSKVVFSSQADGFVTGVEDRRYENVFVKERASGALVAVNPGANGSSFHPSISDDGSKVAFETTATNLTPADPTPDADVLVKDLLTGVYTLISSPGDDDCTGSCAAPQLSGNGQFVAFTSALALSGADTNTFQDVYRRLAGGGGTVLVSRANGVLGAAGDRFAAEPSISDSGATVAFSSASTNYVVADTNATTDVFARNVLLGTTVLASAAGGSAAEGNSDARGPELSGDGGYVAFTTQATNLLGAADLDGDFDVYRRRLDGSQQTLLLSRNSANVKADRRSYLPNISDDGNVVTFVSEGTNLPGGFRETYARTVSAGTTTTLGTGPSARVEALTGTAAERVVRDPLATADREPGLSVVNAGAALREMISRRTGGAPLVWRLAEADIQDTDRVLSADGRYVAFASSSPALPGARTDQGFPTPQVYRRDVQTGEVLLVSRASGSDAGLANPARQPSISADGTKIAFRTNAPLEAADTNATGDAYVRDVSAQTTTLATRAGGVAGAVSDAFTSSATLSADGRHVVFATDATNLGAPAIDHIYVRDLAAATTTVADRADGPGGAIANGPAEAPSISADGTRVAFESRATNLADGDADVQRDVHVRDVAAGTTTLASRAAGAAGPKGDSSSSGPVISADGTVVAFRSTAENLEPALAPWPPSGFIQVVVRNLASLGTSVVSRGAAGGPVGDRPADAPTLSGDGSLVAYGSDASNLGDASGENAIFVRRIATGEQRVVGVVARPDPADGSSYAGANSPALSADGRCLAFDAKGTGLVPGVSPDFRQVFLRVLEGDCRTTPPPVPVPTAPGGGTTSTPAGSTPRPSALVTPRISGVTLSRSAFRVGPRATAVRTVARTRVGTVLGYRLNVPATTTIAVERRSAGRRVGRSCRRATRGLRRRPACARYTSVGRIVRVDQAAGKRSLSFSGRVGRKALRTGRYRFSLSATASGRRSPAVTRAFRVVRR